MEIPSTNPSALGAKVIELVIKIPAWLEKPFVLPLLWYRRLRYGYPFRRIRLSQGRYAIVDPDDYARLSEHRWHAAKHTRSFYAMRTQWSGKLRRTVTIMMHREIMHAPEGMVIDHINHNGLDNRKANLRLATLADNARNARYPKINTSSKYRGVWYNPKKKRWRATIGINNKRKQVGYFRNEINAARAYDEAAKKYYRDFAVLNFPKLATEDTEKRKN